MPFCSLSMFLPGISRFLPEQLTQKYQLLDTSASACCVSEFQMLDPAENLWKLRYLGWRESRPRRLRSTMRTWVSEPASRARIHPPGGPWEFLQFWDVFKRKQFVEKQKECWGRSAYFALGIVPFSSHSLQPKSLGGFEYSQDIYFIDTSLQRSGEYI